MQSIAATNLAAREGSYAGHRHQASHPRVGCRQDAELCIRVGD
jgi:hypothetical protein